MGWTDKQYVQQKRVSTNKRLVMKTFLYVTLTFLLIVYSVPSPKNRDLSVSLPTLLRQLKLADDASYA